MSIGHFKQADKIAPVQQTDGSVTQVTVSGKTRFTVFYGAFGAPQTTAMTIRQGDTETDGAFANRLAELGSVIEAMKASRDGTAHAALEVRRAALADA